jgi:hypothetical protein
MSTSLLSEWTGVVIDLPNAPASSDLTLSFSALNNPESEWGAQASWEIVRTDLPESSKVVTVGIKDSSSQHTVEFGTIGFVMVQEDMYGSLEVIYDQDYVFSPEPFLEPVVELAITLKSDGTVTFLLNGVFGEVWVPPVPEIFTGARTVTLRSSPYINGEKQSSINELDSFGISSGGAGNAKFWTNFVQSFEVP